MVLSITNLLYEEIIWNKEKVIIAYHYDDTGEVEYSELKRLEFQYEAIHNDYIVHFIEPLYNKETDTPYLLIHCS